MNQQQYKERNVLLARDDIGKSKPTTHNLPSQEHAYGVKNKQEQFGVGRLTQEWEISKHSSVKQTGQDYQRLNKLGINARVIRPNQVKSFRSGLDVRVPIKEGKSRLNKSTLMRVPPSINDVQEILSPKVNPYGKANRAQTPVKGIITGVYAEKAESYYA